MNLAIETEQETEGRWIAEIPQIPGALVYGISREDAIARVEKLAFRIMADRLEQGETPHELDEISSVAPSRKEELRIIESVARARADVAAGRLKLHEEVEQLVDSWAMA